VVISFVAAAMISKHSTWHPLTTTSLSANVAYHRDTRSNHIGGLEIEVQQHSSSGQIEHILERREPFAGRTRAPPCAGVKPFVFSWV
jgi:hypothetical protein